MKYKRENRTRNSKIENHIDIAYPLDFFGHFNGGMIWNTVRTIYNNYILVYFLIYKKREEFLFD